MTSLICPNCKAEFVMKEKQDNQYQYHVLRGGSWGSGAQYLRSAVRYGDTPDSSGSDFGFRLVRIPDNSGPSYTFTIDDCEHAIAASQTKVASMKFIPIPGKDYEVSRTLCTQEEWERVMGENPSYNKKGGQYPVEHVSFHDIEKYLEKLNASDPNYIYRLPTEEEWEHFARAGTTTEYSFGDDPKMLGDYAWYFENSKGKTHPVAQKKPNPWGLYDIHGLLWEWTCSAWK